MWSFEEETTPTAINNQFLMIRVRCVKELLTEEHDYFD